MLSLFPGKAWATGKLAVELDVEGCDFLMKSEVRRVLHAELGVDPIAEADSEPTRVVARCVGERLVILVSDPVSRKLLRRNFALRDATHPGMSRLVGIAAAELVLASWVELSLNPTPRVEPEGKPPRRAVVDAARARTQRRLPGVPTPALSLDTAKARGTRPSLLELPPEQDDDERSRARAAKLDEGPTRLRVLGVLSHRAFFSHSGALWGGGVRLGSEPLPMTSWAADMLFETGEVRVRTGRFSVDTWTLGGQLFVAARLRPLTFRFGGGLRAGVTGASLVSDENTLGPGTSAVAPWGWPLLATNVGLRLSKHLTVELSAEASYVVLPVSTGPSGETIRGTWFSAQLGLGYSP